MSADTPTLTVRVLDWYESQLRYWSSGQHGQSEQFMLGALYMLTSFNEAIILNMQGESNGDSQKGQG